MIPNPPLGILDLPQTDSKLPSELISYSFSLLLLTPLIYSQHRSERDLYPLCKSNYDTSVQNPEMVPPLPRSQRQRPSFPSSLWAHLFLLSTLLITHHPHWPPSSCSLDFHLLPPQDLYTDFHCLELSCPRYMLDLPFTQMSFPWSLLWPPYLG